MREIYDMYEMYDVHEIHEVRLPPSTLHYFPLAAISLARRNARSG